MAVLGTLGFNFQVILPLLARFSFDGEVTTYTALAMAMGAGSIAGALLTGARERGGQRLMISAAAAFAAAAALAASAPTLALEMLALALLGAAAVSFAATINAGLQLDAEPAMRGRVMALYSIVFVGTTPIGGPISGWVAGAVSPRASLLLGAAAAAAVAAAAHLASPRGAGRRARVGPGCAEASLGDAIVQSSTPSGTKTANRGIRRGRAGRRGEPCVDAAEPERELTPA